MVSIILRKREDTRRKRKTYFLLLLITHNFIRNSSTQVLYTNGTFKEGNRNI